jgi:hypothetical protein
MDHRGTRWHLLGSRAEVLAAKTYGEEENEQPLKKMKPLLASLESRQKDSHIDFDVFQLMEVVPLRLLSFL